MFIVPYYKSVDSSWTRYSLFLSNGGKELWSIEDYIKPSNIKTILKKNDLIAVAGTPVKLGSCYFVEIDTVKTNLTEFYTWEEVEFPNASEDCWRTLSMPTDLLGCNVFCNQFWSATALPEVNTIRDFFSKV